MDDMYDPIFNSLKDWFMKELTEATVQMFQLLMSWWILIPTPGLSDRPEGTLAFLREHTGWLTAATAMIGLLIATGRAAIQRKGEPFRAAFSDLVNLVVIIFTLAAGVNLLNSAGDSYSEWILKAVEPGNGNWALGISRGFQLLTSGDRGISWVLIGGMLLTVVISSIIQFVLMMFRNAIVVVLVGVIPLAAAARFTPQGNQAYKKMIGWLVAFSLYKPVAATVYAAGFHMLRSNNMMDAMMSLFLLSGAVLSLPATMRVVVPAITEINSIGTSVGATLRTTGHLTVGSTAANIHGFKPEIVSNLTKAVKGSGSRGVAPGGGKRPTTSPPGSWSASGAEVVPPEPDPNGGHPVPRGSTRQPGPSGNVPRGTGPTTGTRTSDMAGDQQPFISDEDGPTGAQG